MTPPRTYSSVSAFIAHWRALQENHGSLSAQEQKLLADIEQMIGRLDPRERDALRTTPAHGQDARRHERAELQLTHLLSAAGWLQD